jgi:hypothetical protein
MIFERAHFHAAQRQEPPLNNACHFNPKQVAIIPLNRPLRRCNRVCHYVIFVVELYVNAFT